MKKKGKYVLVIGAVVVVMLMVSSACAVNVVSNKIIATEKTTSKYNIKYPPNLIEEIDEERYITKNAIPYLLLSFIFEGDLEWKQTFFQIIQIVHKKGAVNKDNIKNILEQNNLGIWDIYIGTSVETPSTSGGYIFSMPGLVRILLGGYISKGGIVTWRAIRTNRWFPTVYYDPEVKVGNSLYDYAHVGRAIGFFGLMSSTTILNPIEGGKFTLTGFSLVVFVR